MKPYTVGWVMDRATSVRRVHIQAQPPDTVLLTIETGMRSATVVALDEEGVRYLQGLLVRAKQQVFGASAENPFFALTEPANEDTQ